MVDRLMESTGQVITAAMAAIALDRPFMVTTASNKFLLGYKNGNLFYLNEHGLMDYNGARVRTVGDRFYCQNEREQKPSFVMVPLTEKLVSDIRTVMTERFPRSVHIAASVLDEETYRYVPFHQREVPIDPIKITRAAAQAKLSISERSGEYGGSRSYRLNRPAFDSDSSSRQPYYSGIMNRSLYPNDQPFDVYLNPAELSVTASDLDNAEAPLCQLKLNEPVSEEGYRFTLRVASPKEWYGIARDFVAEVKQSYRYICSTRIRQVFEKYERPAELLSAEADYVLVWHDMDLILSGQPTEDLVGFILWTLAEIVARYSGLDIPMERSVIRWLASYPPSNALEALKMQILQRVPSEQLLQLPILFDSSSSRYSYLLHSQVYIDLCSAVRSGFDPYVVHPALFPATISKPICPAYLRFDRDGSGRKIKVLLFLYRLSPSGDIYDVDLVMQADIKEEHLELSASEHRYPVRDRGRTWFPVFAVQNGSIRYGSLQVDWFGANGLARVIERVLHYMDPTGRSYYYQHLAQWNLALSSVSSRLTLMELARLWYDCTQMESPYSWMEDNLPGWTPFHSQAIQSYQTIGFDQHMEVLHVLFK